MSVEPSGITTRSHDIPAGHRRRLPTAGTVGAMSTDNTDHIAGKVIVITGAGGGFGRLVAEMTAERGAKVIAADIDGDSVADLADSLTARGLDARACATDVTDAAQMRAMAAFAVESFGAIDVLVNNAGIMPLAFWADHERAIEAWDRCIDINMKGVMHGIAAVHDTMIEQGRGHIVNISSIYGNTAVVGSAIYTATKAAVNIFSESLRTESQGRIKVTTVKPTGVIGTNLGASIVNGQAMIGILGHHMDEFSATAAAVFSPEPPAGTNDRDDIRYWTISPTDLAEQIVYVIDQPWGVSISDITVRASGDQYLF